MNNMMEFTSHQGTEDKLRRAYKFDDCSWKEGKTKATNGNNNTQEALTGIMVC